MGARPSVQTPPPPPPPRRTQSTSHASIPNNEINGTVTAANTSSHSASRTFQLPSTFGTGTPLTAQQISQILTAAQQNPRLRSQSVGNIQSQSTIMGTSAYRRGGGDRDSDSSSDEQFSSGLITLNRLLRIPPSQLAHRALVYYDMKCPICNKMVPSDDKECHLLMCLTRPRVIYNEDVLTEDKEECVICFNDLNAGDTIARLPCLCIYHKPCIDSWFKVKNSCPEHPGDE